MQAGVLFCFVDEGDVVMPEEVPQQAGLRGSDADVNEELRGGSMWFVVYPC